MYVCKFFMFSEREGYKVSIISPIMHHYERQGGREGQFPFNDFYQT